MGLRTPDAQESEFRRRFGARVRELRERAGLTQGEAARLCGLSKVFFGTLERAVKSSTLETVEKVAHGLGVEAADLFRRDTPSGTRDDGPAERLARKVASLAQKADARKVERFERIAKVYFEADARSPKSRPARRRK